ncbi:hypothetical protein ACWERV_10765 [Streptomyces sp. NPDC004031]
MRLDPADEARLTLPEPGVCRTPPPQLLHLGPAPASRRGGHQDDTTAV